MNVTDKTEDYDAREHEFIRAIEKRPGHCEPMDDGPARKPEPLCALCANRWNETGEAERGHIVLHDSGCAMCGNPL